MNNAISRDIPGNCKRPISQVVDTECINIGIDLPPSPKYSKYTLFFVTYNGLLKIYPSARTQPRLIFYVHLKHRH